MDLLLLLFIRLILSILQILKSEFGYTPLYEPIIEKVSVYHDEM